MASSGLGSYQQALGSLRRGGTRVAVGAPKDNVLPLPIFQTVVMGWKVIPSMVGTRLELAEVLALYRASPAAPPWYASHGP